MQLRKNPTEIKSDIESDIKLYSELSKNLSKIAKSESKVNQRRLEYGEKAISDLMTNTAFQKKSLKSSVMIGKLGMGYKQLSQKLESTITKIEELEKAPLNISKIYGKFALKNMKTYCKEKAKINKLWEKYRNSDSGKQSSMKSDLEKKTLEFRNKEKEYLGMLEKDYEKNRVNDLHLILGHFLSNEIQIDTEILNLNGYMMQGFEGIDVEKEAKVMTMNYFE